MIQGTTLSLIKHILIEINYKLYQRLKFIGVGYRAFQVDKRYGRIPLQIAVMSGAPATTVNALIKLDPKTARQTDNNGGYS